MAKGESLRTEKGGIDLSDLFRSSQPVVPVRCLHLDLKGLPPTNERLLSLLDLLAAARYNAVLVEWEDMFPWTCDTRFRCETAYSPDDIVRFREKAKVLGIEIIPLVQCLGHMQTPLKFPEYAHLRELPDHYDVLNPLAAGARELVQEMVDDVLALLPDAKHFHLGGDEAWTFGSHPDTKAFIEEHGKGALYMHHVEPLLDNLLARGVRPILWHDMMTQWDAASLHNIREKADLCVWGYQGHPDTANPRAHYHTANIERFQEHGVSMWAGTAYKGADGNDSELPVVENRLRNMLAWTEIAQRFEMKGVISTAWSRYNTMITQVEPIDAALDVLVLSAAVLHDGAAPQEGIDACREFLKSVGEYECFQACYQSVAAFSRLKHSAWDNIRRTRQNMACATLDPARIEPVLYAKWAKSLGALVARMDTEAQNIQQAFSGLVPDIWISRFTGDRLEPLRHEAEEIACMATELAGDR
jgi:hexosaminidase